MSVSQVMKGSAQKAWQELSLPTRPRLCITIEWQRYAEMTVSQLQDGTSTPGYNFDRRESSFSSLPLGAATRPSVNIAESNRLCPRCC